MLTTVVLFYNSEKRASVKLATHNLKQQTLITAAFFDQELSAHRQATNVLSQMLVQTIESGHSLSDSWALVSPMVSDKSIVSYVVKDEDLLYSTPQNWRLSIELREQHLVLINKFKAEKPSSLKSSQPKPPQTRSNLAQMSDPDVNNWSPLFLEPVLKQWLSLYMTPIPIDDQSMGIFASALNLDNLITKLRNQLKSSQQELELFIYDASGNLIFHPDYGSKLIRQNDNLHLLQRTNSIVRQSLTDFIKLEKQSGEIYQFTDWGNTVFAVSHKMAENGWTVVSYLPEKVVVKQAELDSLKLMGIMAIQFVILLFVSIGLTRRYISIRLRQTARVISRADHLHLDVRNVIDGVDEIDQINLRINNMFERFANRFENKRNDIETLKLEVSENRALAQAVSYSDNAVLILELDFTVSFVDSKSLILLNSEREDVLDSRFFSHIHNLMAFVSEQIVNDIRRKQSWHGELVLKQKGTDEQIWVNTTMTPMRDDNGHVTKYVVSLQDISFIKDSQNKIEKLAYTDELTNLANRSFFVAQLEKFVEMNKRGHFNFALLHFDIDDFKRINDKYGYEGGDSILIQLAERLTERLRQEDVVARMGGDEFALIIGTGDSQQSILNTASIILSLVAEPFVVQGNEVVVSTSIGITMSNDDVKDAELLLQHADLAMFEAKTKGKSTFNFFTQELNDSVRERLDIEMALTAALDNDKLELYYQPKVDFVKKQLVGYEVLLRWNDEKLGFVSPDKFIPIAEQSHLILDISDWVMQKAIQFLASLEHKVTVSINISAKQFESGHCGRDLAALIGEYGVSAEYIELEITESYLMADIEDAIRQLHELKAIGVKISIDDFGTGYSSLSYLKRFPVDTLKIDRSFIKDIPDDMNDVEITGAIIAMAKKLGLEVIAEGAETKDQVEFLRANECYLVQGYYFSKPLPEAQARQWQF